MPIYTYNEMCQRENRDGMQQGMYANKNKNYSIVLLSGHDYVDTTVNDNMIKYSGTGKNQDQKYKGVNKSFKKFIDSPEAQNGKHRDVRVYKRIKVNKWLYLGRYKLKTSCIEKENGYNVIKFYLEK